MDRLLQNWRARKARPWVPRGARVLDIGCHQGEFLRGLGDSIGPSIGIDPLAHPEVGEHYRILTDAFHEPTAFTDESFDVVVLLATLEHIRDKEPLARECRRLLSPGGRVIVTVPTPFVDSIVALLCCLRLADGMSLEEHHGFEPVETSTIFAQHGFELEHSGSFQLGLNRIFVFCKPKGTLILSRRSTELADDAKVGAHV
jgi:SAM-dependent methyltransferase